MARITLIHALRESLDPIATSFARLWPAAELRSVLDDGLSRELARTSRLDARMTERFLALGRYAAADRPDAMLFTCSAFGPCIEAVRADLAPLLVRKPNEAMVGQAAQVGGRIALVASYAPTLSSMPAEFPKGCRVVPVFVDGALAALERGDPAEHDRLVVEAALGAEAEVYALAQFSIARAAGELRKRTARPVLTTPDAAVVELRRTLEPGAPQWCCQVHHRQA
jgi:hypothetical protein